MSAGVVLGLGLIGGVGAMARFLLDGAVSSRLARRFPFGTLAVNLSGSFAMGVLVGLALDDGAYDVLGTGLIGAFTTFSTWALESHRLAEDGQLRIGAPRARRAARLGRAGAGGGAVNADALKLTTYFGEHDRVDGGFAADAFTDVYARHELAVSLLMRGVE